MQKQFFYFPLTGVNWNSGVVLGDIVPCYYPGCERTFSNPGDLSDHIFKDHGTPAGRVDALTCVLFVLVVLLTAGGDQ